MLHYCGNLALINFNPYVRFDTSLYLEGVPSKRIIELKVPEYFPELFPNTTLRNKNLIFIQHFHDFHLFFYQHSRFQN